MEDCLYMYIIELRFGIKNEFNNSFSFMIKMFTLKTNSQTLIGMYQHAICSTFSLKDRKILPNLSRKIPSDYVAPRPPDEEISSK
jgi:hypothetical protein